MPLRSVNAALPDSNTSFGVFAAKDEECAAVRPAIEPRAKCPAVGPEVYTRKTEGGLRCAPQPPACCEAARRAEKASAWIKNRIRGNALLRWFDPFSQPVVRASGGFLAVACCASAFNLPAKRTHPCQMQSRQLASRSIREDDSGHVDRRRKFKEWRDFI
mmetsp:Transcript_27138/g.62708  ORF Transcript_27138/g.62708 Transcript_27138/m.62708 type:complete len:160 (+) Transcript_27138:96-575(+)